MPATTIPVATLPVARPLNADNGFVAKADTLDAVWSFAEAMGWMDKPFHFVVNQWLATRNA